MEELRRYQNLRPKLQLGLSVSQSSSVPLSSPTICFEISSLTKLFTSMLLCQLVLEKKVTLEDPIHSYLPLDLKKLHGITLRHLATHTSGISTMPLGFYFHQTFCPSQLETYLTDRVLERAWQSATLFGFGQFGKRFRYSHLGYVLLRRCLENLLEDDFTSLLQRRILEPLKMKDTKPLPELEDRIPTGYAGGKKQKVWYSRSMLGALGYGSTMEDLGRWIQACFPGGYLEREFQLAAQVQSASTTYEKTGIGLGWLLDHQRDIAWLSGDTAGSSAFLGISMREPRGIAICSNYGIDGVLGDLQEIGFGWFTYSK